MAGRERQLTLGVMVRINLFFLIFSLAMLDGEVGRVRHSTAS
jgi:hypothetical protein